MLRRLLRTPRGNDVEVGVLIPVGCMVPLAAMLGVAIAVGVFVGSHLPQSSTGPASVAVRVIDDGAVGGPAVISTQIVPLR
ncbi:MAG: hypothetical protein LC797_18020 [Chloroflexi bacterium]|nr:hypothetical protein [Chloroflexota bacterium]